MMKRLAAFAVASIAVAPTLAHAGPDCTAEPKDKWVTEDAMKAKAADLGYTKIKVFKVTGSCYEIYGWDKDGQKVEVYFNPVTTEVVKAKVG